MDIKIIYEDKDLLVVDKPAGIIVFHESTRPGLVDTENGEVSETSTLMGELIEKFPDLKAAGQAPRYGMVHRLDKNTSGVLLVAKTSEALIFFQNQFKSRGIGKKYTALVTGAILKDGEIKTLMGRSPADPRKQKAYPIETPNSQSPIPKGLREAETTYKVLKQLQQFTLLEVAIKTGRKHQIRCHLAYIHHPIAGDQVYGFKDSPLPEGLTRQFLHASYLKIKVLDGSFKEFSSDLPEELQRVLTILKS